MEKTMEKIVALAKARGFVYPGSEIYGGLANTWDYGNLGVELKNNVKQAWWQKFIRENPYNVGIDCAILMNPQTWVASGHLGSFSDPLMDCKDCHERFRADKVIEDYMEEKGIKQEGRQRMRKIQYISARRRHREFLSTLRMYSVPPARKCHSESARLVNPSEMKLRRAILRSALGNLSRWSLSFSVSLIRIWNGLHTGNNSVSTG